MYKLKDLNVKLTTLSGGPIADLGRKSTMTYGSALVSCLEMFTPTPGSGEALQAIDLGIRINKASESIELDKTEFEFLQKVLDKTSIFTAIVLGQLQKKLQEIKAGSSNSK